MSTGAGYVRVYYSIIGDERFANVYHDARRLGTWLQLLLVADAMHPADAPTPAYVHRPSMAALVTAGLIDERPHQHFRIHGLDTERGRRSEAARMAGLASGRSRSVPEVIKRPFNGRSTDVQRTFVAPTNGIEPSLAEPSRTEPSQADAPAMNDPYDAPEMEALQWLARHGCALAPTNGLLRKLVLVVERFGVDAVVGKFDRLSRAGVMDGDASGFVFGATDALFPKPDLKALDREDSADADRERFNRNVERTQREQARIRGEA